MLVVLAVLCAVVLRDRPPQTRAGGSGDGEPQGKQLHETATDATEAKRAAAPSPTVAADTAPSPQPQGGAADVAPSSAPQPAGGGGRIAGGGGPIAGGGGFMSRRTYTLVVLYSSACLVTAVGGGIDLFTVEMARAARRRQPTYDVAVSSSSRWA